MLETTAEQPRLRALVHADLELVLDWRNHPDVRRYMYTQHEITLAEHNAWFARLKDDDESRWFVHEGATGQPDGVVYFTQIHRSNRSAYWGFYAAPDALPGTGTRIGLDALDEAFATLGLHKLNAEAIATNLASLRFHRKLGFMEEGLFRDYHFNGQHYVDVVRLGILATEWTVKREEIQTRIAMLNAHSKLANSIGRD